MKYFAASIKMNSDNRAMTSLFYYLKTREDLLHTNDLSKASFYCYTAQWPNDKDKEGLNLTEVRKYIWHDFWISQFARIPKDVIESGIPIFYFVPEIFAWIEADKKMETIEKMVVNIQNAGIDLSKIKIILPVVNESPQVSLPSFIYEYPLWNLIYRGQCEHPNRSVNYQERSKKYTCLNRIHKRHRLHVAATLYDNGLADDGYLSYRGLYLLKRPDANPPEYADFIKACPLVVDQFDDYEIDRHNVAIRKFYTDAYWNFVTETACTGDHVFLTEKTFKPIAWMQPFVIAGQRHSLRVLHNMGYKTFGNYIDESYDDIEDDEERIRCVTKIMLDLARMSHSHHMAMTKALTPILKHNQNLFMHGPFPKF